MSEDGRGGMSDAVAMGADEAGGALDVEVHSGDGLVARGSVHVADLWAVRARVLVRLLSPLSLRCADRLIAPNGKTLVAPYPYPHPYPYSMSRTWRASHLPRSQVHLLVPSPGSAADWRVAGGSCMAAPLPAQTALRRLAGQRRARRCFNLHACSAEPAHPQAPHRELRAGSELFANRKRSRATGRGGQREPTAARPRRAPAARHGRERPAALLLALAGARPRGRRVWQEVGRRVRRDRHRAQVRPWQPAMALGELMQLQVAPVMYGDSQQQITPGFGCCEGVHGPCR